ncbi:MAG: protein kinase [Labilithrix sp.]|nr:protein kinase [Labilithrix sp.]MCW5815624.1 protein kinase [Labilithrix sp.]
MTGTPPDDPSATIDDLRPIAERVAAPLLLAGRYQLGRLLGEGGMGEVHECRDLVVERDVALKTIRRDRSARQLGVRLFREACVQAQLEHPSIVPVYEISHDAAGATFFTMRRLSGISLESVIDKKRARDPGVDESERYGHHRLLAAFSEVCLAVHYAHSRGVLHRDIKPSNIMLGDFGEVYVLDWGLAKLRPEDGGEEAAIGPPGVRHVTAGGATLGTPGYMAPEQIGGNEIDARADVFALGAVLYEILTLEPLLDAAAIDARLRHEPATWDARASLRADVPPELDRICERATALAPADRYASARQLRDALEAYLDGERDVELRKKLAAAHLARAEEVKTKNADEALREVNRALALAPDDPRALELLVELLDSPSATEKGRAEVEAAGIARHQGAQPFVLFFTVPWFIVYPIILYVRGIRDVALAALPPMMWLAASIATVVSRRMKISDRVRFPVVLFMLAIAASTVVTGPLLLIPSLMTAAVGTHMLVQPQRLRRTTFAAGVFALLAPVVLVWLGVFTPYTFPDESRLVVHSVTRAMNGWNLGLFLTATDVAFVFGVSVFAALFRRAIDRAREAKVFTAWQLSKLVSGAPAAEPTTLPAPDSAPLPSIGGERAASPLRPHDRTTFTRDPTTETDFPLLALDGSRYVDAEPIAEDGATRLERVRDRLIGREVAMKRRRDDAGVRDIHREALFQATVEHPAVPPIYDVGSDERGPWFTMKIARGKRLSELLEAGKLPGRHERLSAFAKVCLAIELAHSRGVLHTALHPENVVLGEFGEVHVLGWSHAKRRDDGGDMVPATGPLMQSRPLAALDYLAPEQGLAPEKHDDGTIDERTDVYALGALLRAVASGAAPSAQAELPAALAEICERATKAEPSARFPSARALHDAVEAFLSSDRDDELRRQLAAERLAKAQRRADRALETGGVTARVEALRELGRALALAPDRSEALRLLAQLLATRPKRLPKEVERELEEQIWRASVKQGPLAALIYVVAFVIGFPLYAAIAGMHSPGKVFAIAAAWAVAALIVWRQSTARWLTLAPWGAVAAYVALLLTSFVLGPWFIVPSLTITITMVYVLVVQPRWQYPVIAFGTATVLAPAIPVFFGASDVIDVYGVVEPTFEIRGALHITAATFHFVLPVANLLCAAAAALYATRYRDMLDELEAANRARVHALSRLM